MVTSLEERFWSKVDKTPGHGPNGDCWLWTGAIDPNGYGAVKNTKKRNTHRVAYELVHGPIDRHLVIMHSCDVRLCCNPDHLSTGSRLQNVYDAMAKNRNAKGQTNGNSKLNDDAVLTIRKLVAAGAQRSDLAKLLGVDPRTIEDAAAGRSWKHVQP